MKSQFKGWVFNLLLKLMSETVQKLAGIESQGYGTTITNGSKQNAATMAQHVMGPSTGCLQVDWQHFIEEHHDCLTIITAGW